MKQIVAKGTQTLIVTSNGRPQDLMTWEDLPEKEQQFFDYLEDDQRFEMRFAKHRGCWVDIFDMETTGKGLSAPEENLLARLGWDGMQSDSYWSGVVAKLTYGGDAVVLGRFVIEG